MILNDAEEKKSHHRIFLLGGLESRDELTGSILPEPPGRVSVPTLLTPAELMFTKKLKH